MCAPKRLAILIGTFSWLLLISGCANPPAREPSPQGASASAGAPPAAPEQPSRGAQDPVYVVKPGDTLTTIALATTGASEAWPSIAARNGLREPSALRVGQRLRIPADLVSGQGRAAVRAPANARQGKRVAVRDAARPDPHRQSPSGAASRAGNNSADEPGGADAAKTQNGWIVIQGSYYPREIYVAPDPSSPILTRVQPGTRMPYLGKEGAWYEVRTQAGLGYASAAYARPQ